MEEFWATMVYRSETNWSQAASGSHSKAGTEGEVAGEKAGLKIKGSTLTSPGRTEHTAVEGAERRTRTVPAKAAARWAGGEGRSSAGYRTEIQEEEFLKFLLPGKK